MVAVGIQLIGAVRIQLRRSDGEKLHELTRIIFVGVIALTDVRLAVVHHIQPMPHGRGKRDVIHYLPVIREGLVIQELEVVGIRGRIAYF